ncbi:MAG: hypothetical protein M3R38_22490 [Actinomycetota bacterium]|nr:hypothetical protein [Actinomycetota bacterium]
MRTDGGRPEEYAALVGHIAENWMLDGEAVRLDGADRMAPKLHAGAVLSTAGERG